MNKELTDRELLRKQMELVRVKELEDLLKAYGEWEADLISDNNLWWPYRGKDAIGGKVYDKFIELQARRNELLKSPKESDRDKVK